MNGLAMRAFGQSTEKTKVLNALHELAFKYSSVKHLTYEIKYRFAMEKTPTMWEDSMKGRFWMAGTRYKYIVDNIIFVGDGDLSLSIYIGDQSIYISRPYGKMKILNPISTLDSIIQEIDSVKCKYSEDKNWRILTLLFPQKSVTKRLEYIIDRRTGMIEKVRSLVDMGELYDPSVRSVYSGQGVYALIDAQFMDYSEKYFDDRELHIAYYVKRTNQGFSPIAPFESYKIYQSTPDL